jgi:hypothetical protein
MNDVSTEAPKLARMGQRGRARRACDYWAPLLLPGASSHVDRAAHPMPYVQGPTRHQATARDLPVSPAPEPWD